MLISSFFLQLEALNLPWTKKQVDSKLRQLVRIRHLIEVQPDTDVWHLMGAATHGNEKVSDENDKSRYHSHQVRGFRLNPLSPLSRIVNS